MALTPLATAIHSDVLGLQLRVEEQLIGFYRDDTGEKLLTPEELAAARPAAEQRVTVEAEAHQAAAAQLPALQAKLRDRGIDLEATR